MISQEDYEVIMGVEASGQSRTVLLQNQRFQVARTFMNLLGHISKDQTIQYILILVDDILSVSVLVTERERRKLEYIPSNSIACICKVIFH